MLFFLLSKFFCTFSHPQAQCKVSELNDSEMSREYKDPTDAYLVGDVVRGMLYMCGGISSFLV